MAGQLSHRGFAPELGLQQQDLYMQGKEEPVPEITAVLQQTPQTAQQTPSSGKLQKRER